DSQMIYHVMRDAPTYWAPLLQTHKIGTIEQFQRSLQSIEEALINNPFIADDSSSSPSYSPVSSSSRSPRSPIRKRPRVYLTNTSSGKPQPRYPRDDKNKSKGKTPEQTGHQGCYLCGSNQHWMKECKYYQPSSVMRQPARVHFVQTPDASEEIIEDYDH
ncbi:hypothetical protein SISSUDRAFT_971909, partial [Sistotremastrum suecicum HHB10207 ss-3]